MPSLPPVLALDLEGTLVALSPSLTLRPGLPDFFAFAYTHFHRIAIYSLVSRPQAQGLVQVLVDQAQAPARLAQEFVYVASENQYKDLAFVPRQPGQGVLLIDDNPDNIKPGQESDVVCIPSFRPYPGGLGLAEPDRELELLQPRIATWLRACQKN